MAVTACEQLYFVPFVFLIVFRVLITNTVYSAMSTRGLAYIKFRFRSCVHSAYSLHVFHQYPMSWYIKLNDMIESLTDISVLINLW